MTIWMENPTDSLRCLFCPSFVLLSCELFVRIAQIWFNCRPSSFFFFLWFHLIVEFFASSQSKIPIYEDENEIWFTLLHILCFPARDWQEKVNAITFFFLAFHREMENIIETQSMNMYILLLLYTNCTRSLQKLVFS